MAIYIMSEDLTEKINTLKEEHLPKVGRWEIAQNSEPFSFQCVGEMEAFNLIYIRTNLKQYRAYYAI